MTPPPLERAKQLRSFLKTDATDEAIDPDPEDDVTPVDFVVLPSTGSRGRFRAKLRAAQHCRRQLKSTEVPNRKTACRHKIMAALERVQDSTSSVKPVFFSERERARAMRPTPGVIHEARAGNVPAVLELGFRSDTKSLDALRDLRKGPTTEAVLDSMGDQVWDCDARLGSRIAELAEVIPSARQALARRGDKAELDRFYAELAGGDAIVVLRAVAALGYIGDDRSSAALATALSHPDMEQDGRVVNISYAAMRALEPLHPDIFNRIEAEDSGPEDRLQRWRQWARTPGSPH